MTQQGMKCPLDTISISNYSLVQSYTVYCSRQINSALLCPSGRNLRSQAAVMGEILFPQRSK